MSTHGACNVPPIHLIALTTIPVLSPVIFMPSLYYTPYNSFNYTDADRSRCGVAVCNYALSAFERPPLPTRSSQLSHGRHSGQVSNGLRSSSEGLIPFLSGQRAAMHGHLPNRENNACWRHLAYSPCTGEKCMF